LGKEKKYNMIKMKKKILLIIIAFTFVACDGNETYNQYRRYDPVPCNNCNEQGSESVKRKINRSNISFKDSDCCTWHDCSCPRFEPTKGSVYNNSICKNCGHPKGKHTCGDL
jgi:hypothetical protein